MARFPKSLFGLVLLLGVVVSGCGGDWQRSENSNPASAPETTVEGTPSTPTLSPEPTPPDAPADGDTTKALEPVSIYVMDDECNDFVEESVQVDRDQPIRSAVGKVIDHYKFNAFELESYDVSVDQASGAATIDLRLAPDSPRQFVSLSSCEQRTLFGSLEETLMKNKDWNIKSVKFTSQGQEIAL
jgi:hypothetical protein